MKVIEISKAAPRRNLRVAERPDPPAPGSNGPLYRAIIPRAIERGAFPDLTADDIARLLQGATRFRRLVKDYERYA